MTIDEAWKQRSPWVKPIRDLGWWMWARQIRGWNQVLGLAFWLAGIK